MTEFVEDHVDRVPRAKVLLLDAFINVVLGLLLATFPTSLVQILGVPTTDTRFYTSVLGAILLGIGFALLIEYGRKPAQAPGLGLSGAIAINLCGGRLRGGMAAERPTGDSAARAHCFCGPWPWGWSPSAGRSGGSR